MPTLDRNVKVTCGNCGTAVMEEQLSRQKSRGSGGTLYCPKCPNFLTKSRTDLNYHTAKKRETCNTSSENYTQV